MAENRTELQTLLTSYLADHPGKERELANEFQVAVSTVTRWSSGIARPHPRLAKAIITRLKSKS